MQCRKTFNTVDIVVARQTAEYGEITENSSDKFSSSSTCTNIKTDDFESQQPLSLLAMHDEADLINLSSTPLRPFNPEANTKSQNTAKVGFILEYFR